jgi:hypothetical protein
MILIIGDSFSYDNEGWPSLLNKEFINLSERGIGQYKIFKSFNECRQSYDRVIFCHTSPWRIHTRYHPIHADNVQRPKTDFLLADIDYHSQHNDEMKLAKTYIEKFHDFDYQYDVYRLLINDLLTAPESIHITFHDPDDTKMIERNFNHIWKNNKGQINHMSRRGNELVAQELLELL